MAEFPSLSVLVAAADDMLPDATRYAVDFEARRSALSEELSWWLEVPAQDVEYARSFHAHMPVPGATDRDYLDRWLPMSDDLSVLAGPRFRDRDPDMPFVGIVGGSRAITESDLPALRRAVQAEFSLFSPRYLVVWSGVPAGAWAGTGADNRLLVGSLGTLRQRRTSPELTVQALTDLAFYDDYLAMYAEHGKLYPEHRKQARTQPEADFRELIADGTAWSVVVDGIQGGVVAARPDVASGYRGWTVVELVLAPRFCGRGLGSQLSTLLARSLPDSGGRFLFGTIHHANLGAYRAAIAAGRQDVGGEVVVPLTPRDPVGA